MKTIILGDTHGRDTWKKIIADNEDANTIIFIGDYFDSFDISAQNQIQNFKEICEFKEAHMAKVILLIGNHDHHYFPEIGYTGTSGYQSLHKHDIEEIINKNRNLLQMVYSSNNILFTHAGISEEFLDTHFGTVEYDWFESLKDNDLNSFTFEVTMMIHSLWEENSKAFIFNGTDGSGNNTWQTPIWIRPQSLIQSSKRLAKKGIIQVVGHTQVKYIDPKGVMNQGKYYLIDAIGLGEYLVIEDNKFSVGKVTP